MIGERVRLLADLVERTCRERLARQSKSRGGGRRLDRLTSIRINNFLTFARDLKRSSIDGGRLMMRAVYMPAVICLTLGGCAGLSVGPVNPAAADRDRGIRYYQTAPYLLVRSDGKGGLASEIIYLPDTTMTMSVRPYAYLASNDATLTFSNGTLNEAKIVGDETAVPIGMIDAISKAAAAVVGADVAGGGRSESRVPVPYLFRIKVYSDHVELVGGPAMDRNRAAPMVIRVAIVPPAPSK